MTGTSALHNVPCILLSLRQIQDDDKVLISFNTYITDKLWIYHSILLLFLLILIYLVWRLFRLNKLLTPTSPAKRVSDPLNNKNLLNTLIDNMPDHIYIKDEKSRFVVANRKMAKVFGKDSVDEIIGKNDHDFYPAEYADKFRRDEVEIMRSGIPIIGLREKGVDEEGNEIWLDTTKIPLMNEFGAPVGIMGIGRDVTLRKLYEEELNSKNNELSELNTVLEERQEEIQQQAEELQTQTERLLEINANLEMLSLVASKTDNVVLIMDKEANLEWVNEGFVKHYNMNLEDFVKEQGKNLRDVSGYKDINKVLQQIKVNKKPYTYESARKTRDGEEFWSQTTISPVLDKTGNLNRIIAIDSNITEIKIAENQINEQKKRIEKQNEELTKLNTTKDKLFSIIAHDLKNPFHSIMGFSDLLTRSFDQIEEEKKKEFIRLIQESSASAYALLENLLNWSRTQTNRIKCDPSEIDLNEIINENYQMLRVNLQNKDITLEYSPAEKRNVYADLNMVNTILRNLLSNAVKFTIPGGKISIFSRKSNDRMYITIEDTGIGMTEEEINKLFRLGEFHTTNGTTGESGTGLGLIVCNEFVKRHQGELKVESEQGKGSKFTFSLPVAK